MSQLDRLEALVAELVAAISGIPEATRATITQHQWATIPLYLDEYVFAPAQPAGQPLPVQPQTSGLELITGIVACVPAGATGVVQLANQQIYVGAGVTPLVGGLTKLMQSMDTRSITVSAQGPTALWLCGMQLPTSGKLSP